jgi:hypothetical protein
MTTENKKMQYRPIFRDSSSNYIFEDVVLYDNYIARNTIGETEERDNNHTNDNMTNQYDCFFFLHKYILRIQGYFSLSK